MDQAIETETTLNPRNDYTDLHNRIQELETDKKRIQDEFNIQRAKLKDLFLQKEAELQRKNEQNLQLNKEIATLKNQLDDCKSQLVVDSMTLESNFEVEKRKAQEEIATLQRLVHDEIYKKMEDFEEDTETFGDL